jgi:hypothetical protein
VLGHGWLRHAKLALDLSDRLLGGNQKRQDRATVGLRNDFEGGFHASVYTPTGIYVSRYIYGFRQEIFAGEGTTPRKRYSDGRQVQRNHITYRAGRMGPKTEEAFRRRNDAGTEAFKALPGCEIPLTVGMYTVYKRAIHRETACFRASSQLALRRTAWRPKSKVDFCV